MFVLNSNQFKAHFGLMRLAYMNVEGKLMDWLKDQFLGECQMTVKLYISIYMNLLINSHMLLSIHFENAGCDHLRFEHYNSQQIHDKRRASMLTSCQAHKSDHIAGCAVYQQQLYTSQHVHTYIHTKAFSINRNSSIAFMLQLKYLCSSQLHSPPRFDEIFPYN